MTRINFYSVKLVKESSVLYGTQCISTPKDAADAAKTLLDLHHEPIEHFCILCLNTKNKITGVHTISVGSLNMSIVHPREIFKAAILNNASSIILLHNHPSGEPEPSNEDIETTSRIKNAGELLGINVLDHVIIGEDKYISLKEAGLF